MKIAGKNFRRCSWQIIAPVFFVALAGPMPNAVGDELRLIPDKEAQCAFAGGARKISVTLSNSAGQNFDGEIRTRVFQTASATAVLISGDPWKRITVPSGETVLESASLSFPAVNAKTTFLIQWLTGSNVIGTTEVLVYPTNLFQSLFQFADETNLGVLDLNNDLKPLLRVRGIGFVDLSEIELDHFAGKLAIIGPFESARQMPDGLAKRIETVAQKNVAVVWILPPDKKIEKLQPSFYSVQKSQTAVVVVQPELVADLQEDPRSQLNLIDFCERALHPQPMTLPVLLP